MKNVLFATTAASALLIGGVASAQGIALFGDARLGLGYNIDNDGNVLLEEQDDGSFDVPDDLRAVSRVRFGVNMTGETDSGITFGATIRADNAIGGDGGSDGQNEGSVFVSGAFGTLTLGDTNAADEQWVGDVPGDYTLTSLGELDETLFVSNGGSYGNDGGTFAENPFARPTIRYDFDIMGFGISASSNRDLTDIGVGTGYAADFGGGSWSVGAGYNQFESFNVVTGNQVFTVLDENGDPVEVIGDEITADVPDGEQWSLALKAEYEAFGFGVTYVNLSTDDDANGDNYESENLLLGASYTWDAWSFGVVYGNFLSAESLLEPIDGEDSWLVSAEYDLGGGASINGGVRQTYALDALGGNGGDEATIADFGVKMAF